MNSEKESKSDFYYPEEMEDKEKHQRQGNTEELFDDIQNNISSNNFRKTQQKKQLTI